METTTIKDLLTSAFGILTALVALATFATKPFENYAQLHAASTGKTLNEANFKLKFDGPISRLKKTLDWIWVSYVACGISLIILLMNFVFASVPCMGLTCNMKAVPFVAGVLIGACAVHLIVLGGLLLNLFLLVAKESLDKSF